MSEEKIVPEYDVITDQELSVEDATIALLELTPSFPEPKIRNFFLGAQSVQFKILVPSKSPAPPVYTMTVLYPDEHEIRVTIYPKGANDKSGDAMLADYGKLTPEEEAQLVRLIYSVTREDEPLDEVRNQDGPLRRSLLELLQRYKSSPYLTREEAREYASLDLELDRMSISEGPVDLNRPVIKDRIHKRQLALNWISVTGDRDRADRFSDITSPGSADKDYLNNDLWAIFSEAALFVLPRKNMPSF